MFVKSCWPLMLFAALVAATGPVCAQGTEAGRFLSVVGDVRVGREGAPQRAAQRAAEFYEGESIVTAAGALAQLRMTDGALMSVRGDTEIKLERFSYAGEQDRNASFFMSVLKGGLRTITGVIGRQNRERYRITTATVTIGVRGTDFEIVHVPPQAASLEVPAGYFRIYPLKSGKKFRILGLKRYYELRELKAHLASENSILGKAWKRFLIKWEKYEK